MVGNRIDEIEKGTFYTSTHLKTLKLGNNSISDPLKIDLDGLIGLQELDISMNKLTSIKSSVFASMENLKQLDLRENKIKIVHDNAFAKLTRLDKLDISGNQLTSIRDETFFGTMELKQIKLARNKITEVSSMAFETNTELEDIDLSENNLLSLPVEVFSENTNLQTIVLSGNQLQTLHIEWFGTAVVQAAQKHGMLAARRALREKFDIQKLMSQYRPEGFDFVDPTEKTIDLGKYMESLWTGFSIQIYAFFRT